MAEALDVNTLKRRSRRRLVGAVALVLLAVIVLPMVFDTEPRQTVPPVSVRIPSEDDAKFAPKLASPPSETALTATTPSSTTAGTAPAASTPVPPSAKSTETRKPAVVPPKSAATTKGTETATAMRSASAERARAEAALKGGTEFIVPVAALADPDKVKQLTARLAAARLPYYTEPIATAKGTVTRVRAGPFVDRAMAEKALEKLKGMGLKPGKVFEKS